MQTTFTPSEIAILRSLRQAAPLLFVISMLNRPTGETEIAQILGLSVITARSHLRSLSRLGLILRRTYHNGYELSSTGRFFFKSFQPPDSTPAPPLSGSSADGEFCEHGAPPNSDPGDSPPPERIASTQTENISTQPKNLYRSSQSLEEDSLTEDSEEKTPSKDSDSDSAENRNKFTGTDIPAILSAAADLFDEPILPGSYDPQLLLGWIAQVYSRRARCRFPARVIYSNLHRGLPPDPRFLNDPAAHLPERFLIATGLVDPAPEEPPEDDDPQTDLPPPQPPHAVPEPDESCTLPLASCSCTALQAWQAACAQLRYELPPAACNAYLDQAYLHRFDPQQGSFFIAVMTEYARLWLEDCLTARATRILQGICNRSVSINFFTWIPPSGALHDRL